MLQLTPSQPTTIQMNSTQGHTPAHVPVFVNVQPQTAKDPHQAKQKKPPFRPLKPRITHRSQHVSNHRDNKKARSQGCRRHHLALSKPHKQIQWASTRGTNQNGNRCHFSRMLS